MAVNNVRSTNGAWCLCRLKRFVFAAKSTGLVRPLFGCRLFGVCHYRRSSTHKLNPLDSTNRPSKHTRNHLVASRSHRANAFVIILRCRGSFFFLGFFHIAKVAYINAMVPYSRRLHVGFLRHCRFSCPSELLLDIVQYPVMCIRYNKSYTSKSYCPTARHRIPMAYNNLSELSEHDADFLDVFNRPTYLIRTVLVLSMFRKSKKSKTFFFLNVFCRNVLSFRYF